MPRMRALLLLPLAAAGCLWLPLGSDAVPRIGLEEVQRSAGSGAGWAVRPGAEPGKRGYFFEDSLIAFRTQVSAEGARFRLWNKSEAMVRVVWDAAAVGEPRGKCPAAAVRWEMRRSGRGAPADVLRPGASREEHAVAVARVPTLEGGLWRSVPLSCVAADPVEPRAPLRLVVETEGERYAYTFWYGMADARGR